VALAAEKSVRVQQAEKGVSVIDYIIDGLEAELELERELGVRFVECDRSLLSAPVPVPVPAARQASQESVKPEQAAAVKRRPEPQSAAASPVQPPSAGAAAYDFVFLHDRALSAAGAEMIAKITGAMKRTPESAPLVTAAPLPQSRIYVVLGGNAMKKFFPGMRGAPGQWNRDESGRSVLVTYSPEYILRFGEDSPAVKKIKQDMWMSLKTVLQRLES
jgi:hypothetical protein